MVAFGLAFVAGLLSTLSPCVLPIIPLVLGAAASEHRMGPAALAAGLAISFVAIGMFVATVGFAIGLDTGVFRAFAAIVMVAIGAVLMLPSLQDRLAVAGSPIATWTEGHLGGFSTTGLRGQFAVGLLLGAVWSPCVGPTLGAASVLAAQGQNLGQVTVTMLFFGIGAAPPLLLLGMLSREAIMNMRNRMMSVSGGVKSALGVLLLLIGVAILSGLDKTVESVLVEASPEWLTQLTTRF